MPSPRRVAVMMDLDWSHKRHAAVFTGLQHYAQEHGWQSVVDEHVEDSLMRRRDEGRYDGIIARATKLLALRAARLNTPLVNVWISSPGFSRVPGVYADFAEAGRLRAEHLLSRGLRRFAALTMAGDRGQATEMQGFSSALNEAGCDVAAVQIPLNSARTVSEWRKAERTIAAWMDQWKMPLGVYIGSELHGRMVAQACRNRGWRVPDDVAIIAGWNEQTLCQGLRPTLTSVEIGYERIGYEAARLLDRLMDGEMPPEHPILIPPTGIVVRESTDFVAVDDASIAAALRFIAANSHRDIRQDDVSGAVHMETRTLQRRFQKYLHRPIAAEIRRVRIERAKRELAQTDRSLKQIARDVGFGTPMRMYEVFRRELGITPSQHRRERQVRS